MSQIRTNSLVPAGGLSAGSSGGIVQIRQTLKTDTFSSYSATYIDVTGLSVSITPVSASNKILVLVNMYGGVDQSSGSNRIFAWKVIRDSTDFAIGDSASLRRRATGGGITVGFDGEVYCLSGSAIDSPSTTSSVTYKVQVAVTANGGTSDPFIVNKGVTDDATTAYARMVSSITVMEISG